MRYSRSTRILSLFLAFLICIQGLVPVRAAEVETYTASDPSPQTARSATETAVPEETQAAAEGPVNVYENGVILIHSWEQLQLIGSGQALCGGDGTAVGSGEPIMSESGTAVTYSLQAVYRIAQEITLPAGTLWQLPEGFAGQIIPAETDAERPLYDAQTDTVYIYNPYQLAVMAMDNAAEQPVMSNDMDAATVGMGRLTILEDGSFLTYGPEHNYVISSQFDSTIPEQSVAAVDVNESEQAVSAAVQATETVSVMEADAIAQTDPGGPTFSGQVVKTVGDEKCILLGNEEQIRAIGSGKEVYSAVYQTHTGWGEQVPDTDDDGNYIMLYGGDTDLSALYNGVKDFSFQSIDDPPAAHYRRGVDQVTGAIIDTLTVSNSWYTGEQYSNDASYIIFRDIELSAKWNLPMNFTGEIVPAQMPTTRVLYDQDSGTLYIHNRSQLEAMYSADAANIVVHANDAYVDQFGSGDVVLKSDGTPLTYGDAQKYILSRYFSSTMPPDTSLDRWGRDFPGQVLKTIGGEQYILIGNAEQLRAIGTDAEVYRAVYQWVAGGVDTRKDNGAYIMRYSGDADLLQSQNGYGDFTFRSVNAADSSISNKSGTRSKAGVNQETGEIDPDLGEGTGAKYSSNANYIIFRDIDLNNEAWTPLMFSGEMIGVESPADYTLLWDVKGSGTTRITQTARPTIYNITVNQTEKMNVEKYIGIGFFATVSNKTEAANIGISGGQARVCNLELHDVSITTATNDAKVNQTVISGLLSVVGGLLGGLLDGLTWILTFGQVKLNLSEMLSNLLNARAEDPTTFATGAFAGRVVGDVLIEKCDVTGTVSVNNINSRTGGFVGYAEGMTEYEGLSTVLGFVVELLSALLNVIPGLGLGDLITILLGNVLDVSKLIPTDYINPTIVDCNVIGLTGTVGNANGEFAGGFVGQQVGTIIDNCTVQNSTYTVRASKYGGGFAGVARDAAIEGLLEDVGLELVRVMQPQSLLMECDILNCQVTVDGGDNLGGFVGALANSFAINNTVTGSLAVSGTGSCIGGFAGIGTVGWITNLGADEVTKVSLLSTVRDLLTGLLSSGDGGAEMLLTLLGVAPSAILGVQMDCTSVTVAAGGNYAGGIVGKGDGLYLTSSNDDYLEELSFWHYGDLPKPEVVRTNYLKGLTSVSAGGNYAGGVAASVGTASISGLLNNTLGLGDFIGFTVEDVRVTGVDAGYTVSAVGNYAGGGFGEAVGGMIDNVQLNKLKSVTARNRAGGFAGVAGPGDLAGAGGLQLSLLGLDILKINNLLALGQGVEVEITDSTVTGIPEGYTVTATGSNGAGEVVDFTAAGFLAKSNSTEIQRCHAYNLKQVTAADTDGYAGGFLGTSETGGLADVADEESLLELIEVNGLVDAVGYLIPRYINCTVSYVDGGGVRADVAGGFVADFQSGTVDNGDRGSGDYYSVYNLDHVQGQSYAGGFGGRVHSGALADAGGGLSVLGGLTGVSINVSDLLSVVEAYVPFVKYAGVYSENGFTVTATRVVNDDTTSGSAGGFIGFASGAQVSYCDVNRLKHTEVTPPEDLEAVDAPSYFDSRSSYAVTGGRYAGGFFGDMDIGSAASLGGGLKVLGTSIQLTNILDALSVVVTTAEHSDVYGGPGGFAVLADGIEEINKEIVVDGKPGLVKEEKIVGMAGGFAGNIAGGHVQDCHVHNFSYIIGQIAAGGFVGNFVPGNVASVLNDTSILGGLVNLDSALASVAEDFVPTIRNSTTDCIPCGGAVRAHAASDESVQRGMAGGYVGHNEGGHIWGNNKERWKEENDEIKNDLGIVVDWIYNGPTSRCEAIRIRSVYGHEYAGGFTGLMECADTAQAGGLSLLGGLIEVGNLLGALSVVYPTEEHTAVYGPLAKLDYQTWNSWVKYVGQYGGLGATLAEKGTVSSQSELDAFLAEYVYGYHVVAGRSAHEQLLISEGGDAGGYVGLMKSGTITDGQAHDAKLVRAMRNAGGFAGRMQTGGAAQFGTVSILGLDLNLGQLLNVAQVFVPVVKNSSVRGYQAGMTVEAFGTDHIHGCGYAGGYAGSVYGAQIWGEESGCDAGNLRRVKGTNAVGGYVGLATAATVADVNTNASSGLLQGILDALIGTVGDLVSVLDATVTTIRGASVDAADEAWGFVVDGKYGTGQYANYAGGFAGALEAAVLGEEDGGSKLSVNGLRSVDGGLYAGGFFGLADVTSVATVSGNGEEETTLLSFIKLGQTDVLSAFRTYIYYADVEGVEEGLWVRAHTAASEGLMDSTRYAGCTGGYGGGLMNGSVKNCNLTNLSTVEGLNYVGGFIGHMGKNGAVDLDSAQIPFLLGASAGVLDVFGSHVDDCTLSGISEGYVVKARDGAESVAGGFIGYADVSRINDSIATNQKKVVSDQIAGGFIGKTNRSYLVDVDLDSPLLAMILWVVNALIDYVLQLDELENVGLIDLKIPGDLLGMDNAFELNVMADGNLLYVNLLGIRIGVSLSSENGQDRLHIHIGDSEINLNYVEGQDITNEDLADAQIKLFKGNRTECNDCSVTGVAVGYDVFGGGATDTSGGTHTNGHSGGFVGLNREGQFQRNNMYLCDTVRGTPGRVGPFSGTIDLQTVYDHYTIDSLEGADDDGVWNIYRVYRDETHEITHLNTYKAFTDWEGDPLDVYRESGAAAVLMLDTPVEDNQPGKILEPPEMQDPCEDAITLTIQKIWKDYDDALGLRPDHITVTIWQSYIKNGETVTAEYGTATLTADADWRTEVKGLPVAWAETDTGTGEKTLYYYTYTVTEARVEYYKEPVVNSDGHLVSITNTLKPLGELPFTGGISDLLFVGMGVGLILLGIGKQKPRRRGKYKGRGDSYY